MQTEAEVGVLGQSKASWRSAIRGNVLALGLVSLFTDFSSEMIYPLLPVFLSGLVGSTMVPVYLGLMDGIGETTASLLKIFSGRISDAIGKRKLLALIGYGLSTICRPLMAVAGTGWNVIALRFCDRVGKGVRTSPRDALISHSVGPAYRGLAYSVHRAMDHIGAVAGPIVAVAILYGFLGYGLWRGSGGNTAATPDEMHALRWLFGIALFPGVAAMIALAGKVREVPVPTAAVQPNAEGHVTGWRGLGGRFYAYVGIVTLFALGNSSDLFLIFYGRQLFGWGMLQLMGLWVTLHVAKIIFSVPGGVLSDKLGRRPVIIAGWAVYALVYLGMAGVTGQGMFWLLIAAYGFYHGMTEGTEKALVADFVPAGLRGTGFGIYHGAVGLAALPASLLFGVFWAVVGPRVAFGIGAGLAGAAAVLLTILLSAGRRPEPAEA